MAQITVNTQGAQYQNYLTALTDIRNFYRPRLIEWFNLPPGAQQAWRDNDPILNMLLNMAEKIQARQEDL